MSKVSPEVLLPIVETMRREVYRLPRDIQVALVREANYERARQAANEEIARQLGVSELRSVSRPIEALKIGGLVAEEALRRTR